MTRARAAVVHFTPAYGQVAANRRSLLAVAREAAQQAKLVVLPELATTGFVLGRDQAAAWAEDSHGETVRQFDALASELNATFVLGLALRDGEELRNAQLVLTGAGHPAATYHKHHLYGADHGWATAGDTPGAIAEVAGERVGLLICHDVVWPETLRSLAEQAPTLVALSTNWIGMGEPFPSAWPEAVRALGGTPLLVANRGGAEATARFEDPSGIVHVGPSGMQAQVGPGGPGPYVVSFRT